MISFITPSIEGRETQLTEAVESVQRQTAPVEHHLVYLDAERRGPAHARNVLLRHVRTPLVAFLDDDDLVDPDHVERLVAALGPSDDVAWSYCRTTGPAPILEAKLPSTVVVTSSAADSYVITATSDSANTFTVTKTSGSAAVSRTCDTPSKGACPSSGQW